MAISDIVIVRHTGEVGIIIAMSESGSIVVVNTPDDPCGIHYLADQVDPID